MDRWIFHRSQGPIRKSIFVLANFKDNEFPFIDMAQFQSVVDFSNSRFEGEHDFSEAEFAIQPEFTASNISVVRSLFQGRRSQSTITMASISVPGYSWSVMYLWITRRGTARAYQLEPLYFDRVLRLPTKDGIQIFIYPLFLVLAERLVIGFCPFP